MTVADQLVTMANDYISGRLELAELDRFIHEHVDESLALDGTGDPKALLFGYIQVRLYELDDGLTEDVLRKDMAEYLAEHHLDRPTSKQRATG